MNNNNRQLMFSSSSSGQTQWSNEMTRNRMQIDDCAICLEPWSCEADHQVCCLPCGHLFGYSCISKLIQHSYQVSAKCPKCRVLFRWMDVRKIYGSPVTVLDEHLLDSNQRLEEENELLTHERDSLLKENTELKKQMNIHRTSLVKSIKLKRM